VTFLNRLAFRLAHAIRTRPWIRMFIGCSLIAIGTLELLVGAGHGRLVAFGVLLVVGSATASRARRTERGRRDELEHAPRDADGISSSDKDPS
jgi:hypothetical protein